ncbi:4'-phosphopantetheinyl transferase EntD [Brevibacterium sanguinis]|uniref:4'-phosphopantetheinyl transferase EntD n=2 Tax=Brevibacterium TaxID=1696 RepID=A0A366IKB7_9MICO|nr:MULTISPECIES: 4'-phosphopantetheinyl transferase superfamily protein [Brevibacterium]RBP64935.1 4'-phosphopantetheinyl transferase EntD [Brevibacterium sanguinis]RBP71198.1 4'-phosphopantetheinyl transferase EntD [Brevibacterium celere]
MSGFVPPGIEFVSSGQMRAHRLFAVEERVVAGAVPRRRAEFATVRACARTALARIGHPPVPILPGSRREPLWPAGIVGSMTHCEGLCAAAVARHTQFASVGIDAEPNLCLPADVLPQVSLGEERSMLRRLRRWEAEQPVLGERWRGLDQADAASGSGGALRVRPRIAWDRLLFSAKESIFKAWSPLMSTWLDFTDCEVRLDPERSTFEGVLRVPGPLLGGQRISRIRGSWTVTDSDHIVTIVTVRALTPPVPPPRGCACAPRPD